MDKIAFNKQIIEEFRANEGRVAMFADYPMVILHTIGARSRATHLIPLVLTITDAGEMILFGSYAGSQEHPAWVHNLRAHPEIPVELGTETFDARISEFPADEARARVARQAQASAQFADYVEKAAPRDIPVFQIERA
jgi:deazaflavin-dependent oxidoreductase (nitroreductase family)